MTGAHIFVAVAFTIFGTSFLLATGLLIGEFRDLDWVAMLFAHSHLFVFFPIFGVLALVAFYLPAVVFTDLYWRHLTFGKVGFVGGLIVVAVATIGVYKWLDTTPRSLWEIAPRVLAADAGDPLGCLGAEGGCARAPMLATLAALRDASTARIGLTKFARSCAVDRMLEVPEEMDKERFCFPALARRKGAPCCAAQRRFADEVDRLQADPGQRSLAGTYDVMFLPLKIAFVLLVVIMGPLLASWRNRLDQHYRALVPTIERGMIVGGLAMLFWPAMDYGYQETSDALFGRANAGSQFRLSLVIAPWALLLIFYFLRRLGKQGETIGRIAGVVTAGIAVLRYEELNDWAVRLLGIGAASWSIGILTAIALGGFVALWWPWNVRLSASPATVP
jgi:hypothetical protein